MRPSLCLVESNRAPGNTVDLMRAAGEMGLEVVLLTSDPESTDGLDLRDVAEPRIAIADTLSGVAVAQAVQALGEVGVVGVTTAHDFFAPIAAEAAVALGFPGPEPRAVWDCRRKDELRRRLADAQVPQPAFRVCDSTDEAMRGADDIGYPVVVKPVALADSIGVARCERPDEVAAHVSALMDASRYATRRPVPGNVRSRVLVESYASGREFAVEVLDGTAVDATETHFGPPPGFVEHQHVLTSPTAVEPAREALMAAAQRACVAMGLQHGPAHVEIRLVDNTPVIIEINPRLAGGRIPELYRRATGRDLWRATVISAVSPGPTTPPAPQRDDSGVIRHLRLAGDAQLAGMSVQELRWQARSPCHVHIVPNALHTAGRPSRTSDSIGWAIATAPRVAECIATLDDVWAQLDAQVPLWPAPPHRPSEGAARSN